MFNTISLTSLAVAFLCGILIIIDEIRYRQKMWIMNLVWPLTALYFSIFGLWFYFGAERRARPRSPKPRFPTFIAAPAACWATLSQSSACSRKLFKQR